MSARYRAYGEVVWYDLFEVVGASWLADGAAQQAAQQEELAPLQATAEELQARAQAGGLV